MKTPTVSSATSSRRGQTSLRSQSAQVARGQTFSQRQTSKIPAASVHRKRFSTPLLTLKFLCAGKLNPPVQRKFEMASNSIAIVEYLLQAAFRYLEKGSSSGLQWIIKDHPEILQIRELG